MNLPVQFSSNVPAAHSYAPSESNPSGEGQPLEPVMDPYFSLALNVPSGPIDANQIQVPAANEFLAEKTREAEPTQTGVNSTLPDGEALDEIDIRIYQLESIESVELESVELEVPMPIRDAFVEAAAIDTALPFTSDQPATETESTAHNRPQESSMQDEAGRFIVAKNSVVHIDGHDGFDYIDLSDRDVAHVMFHDASMTVFDASTGESFTIKYQNIDRALFSNGQMIDLS